MKDHKGEEKGRRAPRGRRSGFFGALLLFLAGLTAGLGVAALLAFHINQIPLPLIAPPTRDTDTRNFLEPEEAEDDSLQFHQILIDRNPPQIAGEEEPPAAEEPRPTPAPATYFIQVGAFNERNAADAMLGELALLNVRGAVREAPGQGGLLYRVLVGPFPTAAEAEEVRAQLAFNGYNSSLVSTRSP